VAGKRARSWRREIAAVFQKDLRSELRARSAIYSVLLFSLTTLAVVALTVLTEGIGLTQNARFETGDTNLRRDLLSALLWVVLFFGAMSGVARGFVKEEERHTVLALRLAARPLAVYFGKLVFNVAMLLAVAAAVSPLFLLFFHPAIGDGLLFTAEVVTGCAAMATTATILGAIVARARSGSTLLAVLAFPLLIFVLSLAIHGTAGALAGGSQAANARNQLPAVVSYMLAMVAASAMLFDQVWEA
jgi:heme exporter protein B